MPIAGDIFVSLFRSLKAAISRRRLAQTAGPSPIHLSYLLNGNICFMFLFMFFFVLFDICRNVLFLICLIYRSLSPPPNRTFQFFIVVVITVGHQSRHGAAWCELWFPHGSHFKRGCLVLRYNSMTEISIFWWRTFCFPIFSMVREKLQPQSPRSNIPIATIFSPLVSRKFTCETHLSSTLSRDTYSWLFLSTLFNSRSVQLFLK